MRPVRIVAATLLLSFLAAGAGAWGGAEYVTARARAVPTLDDVVHHNLRLSADQAQRIEGLERDYAGRRRALEAEMTAANLELAQAYASQHAYTPQVQAAIDRSHRAMAELQKASVSHVIAMRSVLTPDQAGTFDRVVIGSLTRSRP